MPRLISRKHGNKHRVCYYYSCKIGFVNIVLAKKFHCAITFKLAWLAAKKIRKMPKKIKNVLRTFGAHFGQKLRTLRLSHFFNVLIKKWVPFFGILSVYKYPRPKSEKSGLSTKNVKYPCQTVKKVVYQPTMLDTFFIC